MAIRRTGSFQLGVLGVQPLPALAQGSDIHNIDLDQLLGLVAVLLKPVGCAGWDRSLVASSNQTPQQCYNKYVTSAARGKTKSNSVKVKVLFLQLTARERAGCIALHPASLGSPAP